MKRVMLYFGSFNPVHRGHIALAEYVLDRDLADEVVLIVSPQSPHKSAADLAPEMARFEMAELATAASRYPDRIKASAIEFMLPRPSYTIATLRHLESICGGEMRFSILMGADQIARLGEWREAEAILRYPIYIYPRRNASTAQLPAGVILMADAPLMDYASTEVRQALNRGEDTFAWLHPDVAAYIRREKLWSPERYLEALSRRLADSSSDELALRLERGRLYYRMARWGDALNDLRRVLQLDPSHAEARELVRMAQEILEYRYTEIYNP